LKQQWRKKKYGFSILLHLKFSTKKTSSIQIKTYSIEKLEMISNDLKIFSPVAGDGDFANAQAELDVFSQ
jgi:hypothetical protein